MEQTLCLHWCTRRADNPKYTQDCTRTVTVELARGHRTLVYDGHEWEQTGIEHGVKQFAPVERWRRL